MVTERRFAAFSRNASLPQTKDIPEGGMCLSAFVIIAKEGEPKKVVLGRVNRKAQWDHIAGLDAEGAARFSRGWMLPSSHLLLFETPQQAAQRILREQLDLMDQKLDGPLVHVEASGPLNHWDIEFIFQGKKSEIATTGAWEELKFVDVTQVKPEQIMRAQADILSFVGLLP